MNWQSIQAPVFPPRRVHAALGKHRAASPAASGKTKTQSPEQQAVRLLKEQAAFPDSLPGRIRSRREHSYQGRLRNPRVYKSRCSPSQALRAVPSLPRPPEEAALRNGAAPPARGGYRGYSKLIHCQDKNISRKKHQTAESYELRFFKILCFYLTIFVVR